MTKIVDINTIKKKDKIIDKNIETDTNSKKIIKLCIFKNPILQKDKIQIFIYNDKKKIMNIINS
jgi:hypothetical protein